MSLLLSVSASSIPLFAQTKLSMSCWHLSFFYTLHTVGLWQILCALPSDCIENLLCTVYTAPTLIQATTISHLHCRHSLLSEALTALATHLLGCPQGSQSDPIKTQSRSWPLGEIQILRHGRLSPHDPAPQWFFWCFLSLLSPPSCFTHTGLMDVFRILKIRSSSGASQFLHHLLTLFWSLFKCHLLQGFPGVSFSFLKSSHSSLAIPSSPLFCFIAAITGGYVSVSCPSPLARMPAVFVSSFVSWVTSV